MRRKKAIYVAGAIAGIGIGSMGGIRPGFIALLVF